MVNSVTLIGNLGKDPELRTTPGGQAVCTVSIATAERVKGADGNWTEKTEWHSVVLWGKTAENVAQYCTKGKQLYILGRLQTRKWQDKEGKDRYTTEVVAERVQFLGGAGKSDGGERPTPARGGGATGGGYGGQSDTGGATSGGYGGASQDTPDDDGIPF